jgi:hypothetical protein
VIKDDKLMLVRLNELSTSCVALSGDIISDDETNKYFTHMLVRWMALGKQISKATSGKEFDWDESVSTKLMFMEISELVNSLKDNKVLAEASKLRLISEIESILASMENVKI